jgi:hypothetical protein
MSAPMPAGHTDGWAEPGSWAWIALPVRKVSQRSGLFNESLFNGSDSAAGEPHRTRTCNLMINKQ